MRKTSSVLKSLLGIAGSAILITAPVSAAADEKTKTDPKSGKVQVKQQDVRKDGAAKKKGADRAMGKTDAAITKGKNNQLTKGK